MRILNLEKLFVSSLAVLSMLLSSTLIQAQETEKAEAKVDISGKWAVESGKRAGADVDAERLPPEIVVTKDSFTIPAGPSQFVMTYEIDQSTKPLSVDFDLVEGGPESSAVGIIKMEDGKMTLCYDPTGQTRPENFESTEENGFFTFVMTKAGGDKKFDPAKMVGDWECVMGMRAGAEVAQERMASEINFTKDMITIPVGPDMAFKMSYTVDAEQSPAAVDMQIKEGPGEGNALGIVKMEDGVFVLCYDPTGENRPESFESTEENGFFLFKMEAVVDQK